MMKLLDILTESMADGKAFKSFVDHAIAKQEINANEGLNRGDVRKKADLLLDTLHALTLSHLHTDNTENIKKQINLINNSDIDWEHDVAKSVQQKYHGLMDFVNNKMDKIKR